MTAVTAKLDEGGRVVIPAEYRKALGLKPGDKVVVLLEENGVRLLTQDQAIKEAQAIARTFIPPGVSLVDELLRERREEAARE